MERYYVSSVVGKTVKIVHIIIGLNVGGAELSLRRLIDIHHKNNTIEHIVVSLTFNSLPFKQKSVIHRFPIVESPSCNDDEGWTHIKQKCQKK